MDHSRGSLDHAPKPKTSFLIEDILFHRPKVSVGSFFINYQSLDWLLFLFLKNSSHSEIFLPVEKTHSVVINRLTIPRSWITDVTRCCFRAAEVVDYNNSSLIYLVTLPITPSFQMLWLPLSFARLLHRASTSAINAVVKWTRNIRRHFSSKLQVSCLIPKTFYFPMKTYKVHCRVCFCSVVKCTAFDNFVSIRTTVNSTFSRRCRSETRTQKEGSDRFFWPPVTWVRAAFWKTALSVDSRTRWIGTRTTP